MTSLPHFFGILQLFNNSHLIILFAHVLLYVLLLTSTSLVNGQQCLSESVEQRIPLSLGIFLSDPYKRQLPPIIDVALRHIQHLSQYFDDYCLKLIYKDTKKETSVGMQALFELMNATPRPFGIFGDAYTNVNEPLAMASKYWHLLHLSYAETDAKFATADAQEMYPTFFRIVPGDQNLNNARGRFISRFHWKKVGTIKQSDDPKYALPHEWLTILLEHKYRVNVNYTAGITHTELESIEHGLLELKKRNLRIFIGDFSETLATRVMCEVYWQQMYGKNYVWILPGYQNDLWWKQVNGTNCSIQALKAAIDGHFAIKFAQYSPQLSQRIIGDKTVRDVKQELESACGNRHCGNNQFIGYAYDGVWALAIAINTASLKYRNHYGVRFRPTNDENSWKAMHKLLFEALDQTLFQGVTGTVKFKDNDRLGIVEILRWCNGSYVNIGYYNSLSNILTPERMLYGWKAPLDSNKEIEERVYVDHLLFIVSSLVALTGIAVAIIFLSINIRFRNYRFIKMSSPNLNNLIIAGSICTYASIILLGIDTRFMSYECFVSICYIKTWVLCLGFTLAFGSMFSKTWRVHSIFTNICMNKKAIKDYKLFLIVGCFVLLDVLTLLLWAFISPYSVAVDKLDSYVLEDKLIKVKPQVERCYSGDSFMFQAILLVSKGLLMILGCFLAWETRHVNVPALNDSKYIGLSVYIVVVVSTLGISLAFILQDRINQAYGLTSFFIFVTTTATLCLVFVPKVWVVLKRGSRDFDQRCRKNFMRSVVGTQPKHSSSHNSAKLIHDEKERLSRMEKDNLMWKRLLEEKSQQVQNLLNGMEKPERSIENSISGKVTPCSWQADGTSDQLLLLSGSSNFSPSEIREREASIIVEQHSDETILSWIDSQQHITML